jgi:hypothetical protein
MIAAPQCELIETSVPHYLMNPSRLQREVSGAGWCRRPEWLQKQRLTKFYAFIFPTLESGQVEPIRDINLNSRISADRLGNGLVVVAVRYEPVSLSWRRKYREKTQNDENERAFKPFLAKKIEHHLHIAGPQITGTPNCFIKQKSRVYQGSAELNKTGVVTCF